MIGEPITAGVLCQNVLRLAGLAETAYRELIEQLRGAMVVHADETGWRIGTLNTWLWVFTNQETSVYLIRSVRPTGDRRLPDERMEPAVPRRKRWRRHA